MGFSGNFFFLVPAFFFSCPTLFQWPKGQYNSEKMLEEFCVRGMCSNNSEKKKEGSFFEEFIFFATLGSMPAKRFACYAQRGLFISFCAFFLFSLPVIFGFFFASKMR